MSFRSPGFIAVSAVVVALGVSPVNAQTTWYVDCDGCTAPGTGIPGDPFCAIQDAIDVSSDMDTVLVSPGVCNEAINFGGRAITVRSSGGAHATVIDGSGLNDNVVKCINREGPDTVLEGFTIAHARAGDGAGMRNEGASPTVRNCLFIDNQVVFGITRYGGGVANLDGSNGLFVNCAFIDNTALGGSHANIGGGMANGESHPTLLNCTFTNNASVGGGAMWNANDSHPVLSNCIVWGNIGGEILNGDSSDPTVSYSDVLGGHLGIGNIDDDPLFLDPPNGDVRLDEGSACIDTGDNSVVTIPTDLDGRPRVRNGTVDMGAYEFQVEPNRVDATIKGSLLIYPMVELKWDAHGNLTQDTFVTILNDYPLGVFIRCHFVNGDGPLDAVYAGDPPILLERAHAGWTSMSCMTWLTQNEPTYFSAATGLPAGCQPFSALDDEAGVLGRLDPEATTGSRVLRGYMLAYAVDSFGNEISWNHLSGSVTVVDYAHGAAWEYNAYALQASEELGEWTDDIPGELQLDGTEYQILFDRLLLDFYASGLETFSADGVPVLVDTDLTLMPVLLDLRQEARGPVTTKAHFDIWNQNEASFSGTTRCVTCWDQTLLSEYGVPNYFGDSLQTDKGKARIDGVFSTMCDNSEDAPLLGVAAKVLEFDGASAGGGATGMTLTGQGEEAGFILTDIMRPPGTLLERAAATSGPDARSLRTIQSPREK